MDYGVAVKVKFIQKIRDVRQTIEEQEIMLYRRLARYMVTLRWLNRGKPFKFHVMRFQNSYNLTVNYFEGQVNGEHTRALVVQGIGEEELVIDVDAVMREVGHD